MEHFEWFQVKKHGGFAGTTEQERVLRSKLSAESVERVDRALKTLGFFEGTILKPMPVPMADGIEYELQVKSTGGQVCTESFGPFRSDQKLPEAWKTSFSDLMAVAGIAFP